MVFQHTDSVVLPYISKHAWSPKSFWDEVYNPYTMCQPMQASCFLESKVVVRITEYTLQWAGPCKLDLPGRCELLLCRLLIETLRMASAGTFPLLDVLLGSESSTVLPASIFLCTHKTNLPWDSTHSITKVRSAFCGSHRYWCLTCPLGPRKLFSITNQKTPHLDCIQAGERQPLLYHTNVRQEWMYVSVWVACFFRKKVNERQNQGKNKPKESVFPNPLLS